MKAGKGLPTVIWVLLGLLALSWAGLLLRGPQRTAYPSAMSYDASGLKAFATILQELGYRVEITREPNPKIGPDEVAVICNVWVPSSFLDEDLAPEVETKDFYGAKKAVILPFARNFLDSANEVTANPAKAVSPFDPRNTVEVDMGVTPVKSRWEPQESYGGDSNDYDRSVVWHDAKTNSPFATLYRVGDVQYAFVADGIGATNRFLSRRDNAAFFAGIVRSLADPGATVVFVEASVGNTVHMSVLDYMGDWAKAVWWQTILFGVVVVYTVGRRFGIPDVLPFTQRGTRELVDAVADVYKRSRATHAALETVLRDCDRRVRQSLKLSRDAPRSARDDLLPESLAKAFFLAEAATKERGPEAAVMRLARRLEAETDAFLGTKKKPVRRRTTSR